MTAAIILWATVNLSAAPVDTVETHAQAQQLRIATPSPALPEEIRAFLLDPPSTEIALAVPSSEFEFHARTKWLKLSPGDAKSLGEILLTQDEHHPGGTKACVFQTTLAYRMKRANRFLTIQVCHPCAQAYLDSPHERAGLALDRGNGDLIALARKYFPKDEVLSGFTLRSPEGSSGASVRAFPSTPFGHRFVAAPSTGLPFRVVQFDQNGIHWNESDLLGLFERVTMDSLGNLTGRGGVRGRYDSRTGVLIWNGYPYDVDMDPKK